MLATNLLDAISNTSGINTKKGMVQFLVGTHPIMKDVIHYTYDPYKNYHIRKFPLISPNGTGSISAKTFEVLDDFNSRSALSQSLLDLYETYTDTLSPDAQMLFNRILSRDLRIGLNVKSFNSIWPGLIPTFDVMLAQKIDWKRITFPCYSSVKLDGVRAIFSKGIFYTRSGKALTGLDVLQSELKNVISIDGELIIRGQNFQTGCGNIRSLGQTPDALFCMFELPRSDMSFPYRLDALKNLRTAHTRVVKHIIVNSMKEARDHYISCRKAGFEGTVIKPLDYDYQTKRSFDWMKIKAIESDDLPMIGVYEGTGKYKNQLGGIIVQRGDVEVRVGGGFSDAQRKSLWNNWSDYIGTRAEVLYQEVTPDESLRHPRFLRWREDK